MKENINNTSEEVDLGKLFTLIGDGFRNMFNGILNLLKNIFHYLILGLIFLKKNVIVIGLTTILGGAFGYFLSIQNDEVYQSNMILKTNFGSGHQLYKQIDYLNTLIDNEKYEKLASIFNINKKESETLIGFDVEPFDKQKNLLKEYDVFINYGDTILTNKITLEKFVKRYREPDYRLQNVFVEGANKDVFEKLNTNFLKLIENDYYKRVLEIKTRELNTRRKVLEHNLVEIDSLRRIYKKVALLNAQKVTSSGTNINLEKQSVINKDVTLFRESNGILNRLKIVDKNITESAFISKKMTEFTLGESSKQFKDIPWLKFAILGFLLSIVAILSLDLNKYLNNYQKQ